MEKIYSYDLYKKRTNNSLEQFFKDYLKIDDSFEESNLEKILDNSNLFKKLVSLNINNTIAIIGDYDVDGVSATAIMYKGLKKYGVKKVICLIPDRFIDGYGMNKHLVDKAKEEDASLIITVDNGIKAFEAIDYANELGIDVVVTDHHLKDSTLPNAKVIINSHIDNTSLKTEDICGGMIAYLLIKDLLQASDDELKEELFIASMSTISDVMPIKAENKYIIKKAINNTITYNTTYNKGLDMLMTKLKISLSSFDLTTISFKIAPLLNTPGRLKSAHISLDLLILEDSLKLVSIVDELINLNDFRKKELTKLKEEANSLINKDDYSNVITFEDANEGLIGIVAGNICESTNKPTFVFTKSDSGLYKGSGRSPKWCDLALINDELFKDLMPVSSGGHSFAMGLSFESIDDIKKFKFTLDRIVSTLTHNDDLTTYLRFPSGYSPKEVKDTLDNLGPFGEGIEEPVFAISTKINQVYPLGKGHTKIRLSIDGNYVDALYFFHTFEPTDDYFNIYFKIHKEFSTYSKKLEYKFFVENIKKIDK